MNVSKQKKLAIQTAIEILSNPKVKAGLRAHLAELIFKAEMQEREITAASRQHKHEIRLAEIRAAHDTRDDFAAKVNHVIDARLQKERNGAK